MNLKITILLLTLVMIDPTRITRINKLKADAKKAFNEGNYKVASQKYRYLIDSLDVSEDEVKLNLAHANYLAKDTASAKPLYQELTQSVNNQIRSRAFQQLGLMTNSAGKSEEALSQFKQAIKADPANNDARYNYEMLKKKLEEQKKKEQQKDKDKNKDQKDQKQDQDLDKKDDKNKQDQNKDKNKEDQKKEQEKKDQQDQQKKDQEKQEQEKKEQEKKDQQGKKEEEKKDADEKKEQSQEQKDDKQNKDDQKVPKEVSDKLKQMNMSEQKAKMILEAMKNQEVQYLQQNKRKATKPKDKGKPDW